MKKLSAGDVLRAADVKRWQIVATLRPQSVAEHTYGVMVLAMELVNRIHWGQRTYRDLDDAMKYREIMDGVLRAALVHDMPEVVMGDIPTPVKDVLKIRDKIEEVESSMSFNDLISGDFKPEVLDIIQQADLLEAVWFMYQHRSHTEHSQSVYEKLRDKLKRWPHAEELFQDLIDHVPVELNDFYDET